MLKLILKNASVNPKRLLNVTTENKTTNQPAKPAKAQALLGGKGFSKMKDENGQLRTDLKTKADELESLKA